LYPNFALIFPKYNQVARILSICLTKLLLEDAAASPALTTLRTT